jgi:hypothetical protein
MAGDTSRRDILEGLGTLSFLAQTAAARPDLLENTCSDR